MMLNKIRLAAAFALVVSIAGSDLLGQSPRDIGAAPTNESGDPRPSSQANSDKADEPVDPDADEFAEFSLEELMDVQVVVTAGRREQRITSVPYAISVVTADDIRASGARSIPDALRLVPGIDVADLSFGNAAVSPRGFHGFIANQTLVLVDGRQIFDSLFGGTLWGAWPFQLEDVDRIEVIRGPGGVTWGANAVNGVINIITKDPADQLGLTMTFGGGSRGSFKQHIGYAAVDGKLRLRMSGEYEASDGYRDGGSLLRKLEDDYKGGRFGLHAIYDGDNNDTFTFSGGSAIVDGGFPPAPMAGLGTRRNSDSQASFLLFNWERRLPDGSEYNITVFGNDFHASPGAKQIDYRYQQIGLQFSHTLPPHAGHLLTWGFDGRIDLLDSGNSDPYMLDKGFVATTILGLYLHDEWRFAPRWALDLGGRVDYESYGGFAASGRVALSFELSDNSTLYTAVSNAYHMATAASRFLNIPLVNGLVAATVDKDVDNATLVAFEAGYRARLFHCLDTSVNIFWHQYDGVGVFSLQLGPPGLVNNHLETRSGRASLYGVEWEAKYKASDKLTLLANYTYQQLNWSITESFVDQDAITPPKHKAMLGARYAVNDQLRLAGNLFFVDAVKSPDPANPISPHRIDPYLRLDLNAEYEFREGAASISVGVRNLLDSGHLEGSTLFLNDAEVPRMVFAELRISIK